MLEPASEIVRVQAVPYSAGYNWSVGVLMEKFIKSLADRKLLAAKCPNCGYVYSPPRNRCGKCASEIGEGDVVELSGKGELVSYTAASVELDGAGNFVDLEEPKIIGAVKPDGADSLLFLPLVGVSEKDLKPGIAVQAVWSDKTEGKIADLSGFKPV